LSALSAGYKSAAPRLATPSITTTPGTDRIKVAWKAVAGAQGYRIYRKTSATGSYSLVKIVTSGATTSWTQYGLVTGRAYYYVIRAYRVVDGTTQYSFLSNVSAAKPT
jgi:fibronectin type 3 domain-containing protein